MYKLFYIAMTVLGGTMAIHGYDFLSGLETSGASVFAFEVVSGEIIKNVTMLAGGAGLATYCFFRAMQY